MEESTRSTALADQLAAVRRLMGEALSETVLARLLPDTHALLNSGKMLRSRLLLRVGPAAEVPLPTLHHAAAAVELIHAASLLHDDVIDGGFLRRNLPTFWVEKGVPGAILVGDLMLFKGLDLAGRVEEGRLMPLLVRLTGEVCDAESEQELVLRGKTAMWEHCVRIARRKTGALFAFAATACGGTDPVLAATLRDAGYAIGTAYQLADDVLDSNGDETASGKTLGTDLARAKTTAATAWDGPSDAATYADMLCRQALTSLEPWPAVHAAWSLFNDADLRPALTRFLDAPARAQD
jgi:octaprenyl-diphosphate synthase